MGKFCLGQGLGQCWALAITKRALLTSFPGTSQSVDGSQSLLALTHGCTSCSQSLLEGHLWSLWFSLCHHPNIVIKYHSTDSGNNGWTHQKQCTPGASRRNGCFSQHTARSHSYLNQALLKREKISFQDKLVKSSGMLYQVCTDISTTSQRPARYSIVRGRGQTQGERVQGACQWSLDKASYLV